MDNIFSNEYIISLHDTANKKIFNVIQVNNITIPAKNSQLGSTLFTLQLYNKENKLVKEDPENPLILFVKFQDLNNSVYYLKNSFNFDKLTI